MKSLRLQFVELDDYFLGEAALNQSDSLKHDSLGAVDFRVEGKLAACCLTKVSLEDYGASVRMKCRFNAACVLQYCLLWRRR